MNGKQMAGTILGTVVKIVIAVVIVFYVYKASAVAYDYGYRIFGEKPITSGEGRTVSVVIPEEADAKKVGEILEMKGLIRDAKLFQLQEFVSDYHDCILPGEYELNTSMTAEEMLEVMSTKQEKDAEEGNKSLDEMAEESNSEEVVDSENGE